MAIFAALKEIRSTAESVAKELQAKEVLNLSLGLQPVDDLWLSTVLGEESVFCREDARNAYDRLLIKWPRLGEVPFPEVSFQKTADRFWQSVLQWMLTPAVLERKLRLGLVCSDFYNAVWLDRDPENSISLTLPNFKLLTFLADPRHGNLTIPVDSICKALTKQNANDSSMPTYQLKSPINVLKKKVRNLGLSIENEKSVGYKLVLLPPELDSSSSQA